MLQMMLKLKLFFSVCIIFVGQQLSQSTLATIQDSFISEKSERYSCFAESHCFFIVYGEVQSYLKLKTPYFKDLKSF